MKKWFEYPKKVLFVDAEENECFGIAYGDEVICLCCGLPIHLDNVKITKVFENWSEIEVLYDEDE